PDAQELRRRGAIALRELLTRLVDRRPVALFIDDLQWGDLDSASLLAELLRGPEAPALFLVLCYRREDASASPLLRALRPLGPAPRGRPPPRGLAVEPLEPAAARHLAATLLGREGAGSAEEAEAIARESRGSPLLLQELVREWVTFAGRDRRAHGLS